MKNMVKLFVFSVFFVFFASCVHSSPYLMNKNGVPLHHCNLPILFGTSVNVSPTHRLAIEKAFLYWNSVTNKNLFYYMGVVDIMPMDEEATFGVLVAADTANEIKKETTCAIALPKYFVNTGCISSGRVLTSLRCMEYDLSVFESVMRHEAGHILGLAHNSDSSSLMYRRILGNSSHPIDATEEEIELIKKLYKD